MRKAFSSKVTMGCASLVQCGLVAELACPQMTISPAETTRTRTVEVFELGPRDTIVGPSPQPPPPVDEPKADAPRAAQPPSPTFADVVAALPPRRWTSKPPSPPRPRVDMPVPFRVALPPQPKWTPQHKLAASRRGRHSLPLARARALPGGATRLVSFYFTDPSSLVQTSSTAVRVCYTCRLLLFAAEQRAAANAPLTFLPPPPPPPQDGAAAAQGEAPGRGPLPPPEAVPAQPGGFVLAPVVLPPTDGAAAAPANAAPAALEPGHAAAQRRHYQKMKKKETPEEEAARREKKTRQKQEQRKKQKEAAAAAAAAARAAQGAAPAAHMNL